jgi:Ca2+-binding RTX toxin-like protein
VEGVGKPRKLGAFTRLRVAMMLATLAGGGAAAGVLAGGTAGAAPPAAETEGHWTCRASAARVSLGGQLVPEPLTANAIDDPCAGDSSGVHDVTIPGPSQPNAPGQVILSAAYATTTLQNAQQPPRGQIAGADSGVANVTIVDSNGNTVLQALVLRSTATGKCIDTASGPQPSLTSTSSVLQLTLPDGTTITQLNDAAQTITDQLSNSPLGQVIQIRVNEKIEQPGSLTQRALHVTVPNPQGGDAILDVVVGESKVDYTTVNGRNPCAPPLPPETSTTTTTETSTSTSTQSTTTTVNSTQTQTQTVTTSTNNGNNNSGNNGTTQTIVVERPVGGNEVPLSGVKGYRTSPCRAARFGRQVGVLGTGGNDHITGTSKADRIFALGGNDFVSGGLANDCEEGGAGNDRLDGGNDQDFLLGGDGNDNLNGNSASDTLFGGPGSDRIYGGSGSDYVDGGPGNDRINGGPGNDTLLGGAGNDNIVGWTGADRVFAGPGNDFVDVSKLGRPAFVDCGPGTDTVRINSNERNRTRHCERVELVTKRVVRR